MRGGNFSDAENAPVTDDQGMLKIDHQISANNRVSGTLFLNRSATEDPFHGSQLPNYSNAVTAYSQNNVVINDTIVVKPNLISETRFSYVLNYNSTVQTILRELVGLGQQDRAGRHASASAAHRDHQFVYRGPGRRRRQPGAAEHLGRFAAFYLDHRAITTCVPASATTGITSGSSATGSAPGR